MSAKQQLSRHGDMVALGTLVVRGSLMVVASPWVARHANWFTVDCPSAGPEGPSMLHALAPPGSKDGSLNFGSWWNKSGSTHWLDMVRISIILYIDLSTLIFAYLCYQW